MLSSCETPASNSAERRGQHQSWKREQMPLWMNPRPEIRRGGQFAYGESTKAWASSWMKPMTNHSSFHGTHNRHEYLGKHKSWFCTKEEEKETTMASESIGLDTMIQAITLKDDEELKWSNRHAPLLPLITSSHWHPWGFPGNFWEHFEKHWCGT